MSNQQPIIIKKRKHADHAPHGGAWKVAYADFVTSMMAFFLVLWIMGLSEGDRLAIAGYFNDPMGTAKTMPTSNMSIMPAPPSSDKQKRNQQPEAESARKAEQDRYYAAKAKIEQAVKEAAKNDKSVSKLAEGVKLTVTKDGLLIEFMDSSGEVFFDVGSATIKPEAQVLVSRIAPVLEKLGSPFFIDGHTDSRPYGTVGYDNLDLSGGRAAAFRHALEGNGVDNKLVLAVRANGDRLLKIPEDPYDFRNRRVSLLIPFQEDGQASSQTPEQAMSNSVKNAFGNPVEVAPDPRGTTETEH